MYMHCCSGDSSFVYFVGTSQCSGCLSVGVLAIVAWVLSFVSPFVVNLFPFFPGDSCVARLVFVGLVLGTIFMRFAGACWPESASPSRRLYIFPALFVFHCFGRLVSGFVCLALLRHGSFPIFQVCLYFQALSDRCMLAMCMGSLSRRCIIKCVRVGYFLSQYGRRIAYRGSCFHSSSCTRAQCFIMFLYGAFSPSLIFRASPDLLRFRPFYIS